VTPESASAPDSRNRSDRLAAELSRLLANEPNCCQTIFNSVSNGITVCDATHYDHPLIYMNPAFEEMTGYSPDEVLGQNCRFMQGSDTDQTALVTLHDAIRDSSSTRVLLRNYRKDGTLFWNQLYLSPIFDSAGKLSLFVGIQNDVTARVEADLNLVETTLSLRESEAQLQAVFDTMTEGIVVIDRGQNIVRINQAALRLFDLSERSLAREEVDDTFQVFLPTGELLSRDQWPGTRALAGEFVHQVQRVIRRREIGLSVKVEVSTALVSGPVDNPEQIVVTYKVITQPGS
jgi:PAS domain S-box-containing protein